MRIVTATPTRTITRHRIRLTTPVRSRSSARPRPPALARRSRISGHDHEHPDNRSRGHAHTHRSLPEIFALIDQSALSPSGRDRAKALFDRLAVAEAAIHQMPVEQVHLHEVGALDSIIDIVGAVFAFEWLNADRIVCSPLNVGGGMVKSAHGLIPVPAPATLRLLGDAPIYSGAVQKELVTPTGALIATAYATAFGPVPAMAVERVGYGAGTRDNPGTPNVLRILVGRAAEATEVDRVVVLECEIDDMNPQIFGVVMDRLYAAGALDVYYVSAQMKKNRPGTLLTVVAPPELRSTLSGIIFSETTTIGLRHHEVERERLAREIVTVETPLGAIRFKVALARRPGRQRRRPSSTTALASGGRARPDRQGHPGARRSMLRRARQRTGPTVVSRFYITTPIYYINAEPHLGHAYTTMVADAVARAHRLMGDDVFFLTGTDEHGQKVERAAQKSGLTAPAFADRVAAKFRRPAAGASISSNDDFIRTTEPRHYQAAQALWRRVRDRGFIYKDKYEGWYCTVDEVFVPETQLAGRPLSDLRQPGGADRRGELLLQAVGVPAAAARSLPAASRVRHAGHPAQRDAVVSRGRPRRPERQPHVVQVGHSGAGRPGPRHVRVVRCADQLHDRGGIRLGPGRGHQPLRDATGPRTFTSSARRSSASTRSTGRRSCSPPACRCRARS